MPDGTRIAWMRDPATAQLLELFELSNRSPLYAPFPRAPRTDRALIFGVREPDPLVARLTRAGARVVARFDQGNTRFVFLRESNGIRIELLSWRTSESSRVLPPLVPLVRPRRGARRR